MCGWIKIHRQIKEHWLYTENRVYSKFEAWMDILMSVNFTDAQTIIKGKLYNVKRGDCLYSLETWSKRWGWDKSKVRRFMSLLEKDGMIVLKSDTTTTQLTVCKYDSYQDNRHTDETQTTHRRHADDTQTTLREEEEERKKEKRKVFIKPTIEEIRTEMLKKQMIDESERFYHYYESNGWMIGKNKMKCWKSAIVTWKKNQKPTTQQQEQPKYRVF